MFLKKDNLQLGLILGFLTPLFVFVLLYYMRFSGYGFSEFGNLLLTEKKLITFFGAWSLVGNTALFTVYINTDRDRTARGIFIVTLVYGIGVLLLKALL